jgi:hypothetical protein
MTRRLPQRQHRQESPPGQRQGVARRGLPYEGGLLHNRLEEDAHAELG